MVLQQICLEQVPGLALHYRVPLSLPFQPGQGRWRARVRLPTAQASMPGSGDVVAPAPEWPPYPEGLEPSRATRGQVRSPPLERAAWVHSVICSHLTSKLGNSCSDTRLGSGKSRRCLELPTSSSSQAAAECRSLARSGSAPVQPTGPQTGEAIAQQHTAQQFHILGRERGRITRSRASCPMVPTTVQVLGSKQVQYSVLGLPQVPGRFSHCLLPLVWLLSRDVKEKVLALVLCLPSRSEQNDAFQAHSCRAHPRCSLSLNALRITAVATIADRHSLLRPLLAETRKVPHTPEPGWHSQLLKAALTWLHPCTPLLAGDMCAAESLHKNAEACPHLSRLLYGQDG